MDKDLTVKKETAVAVKKDVTIKSLLTGNDFMEKVAKVVPKYITPERFVQVSVNCITKNPGLLNCTPQSFFGALMNLAQSGLTPNGRDAHLIPYGKECTLNIDYKGYVKLALRNGNIKKVFADVVCKGDEFDYDKGTVLHHRPNFLERGEMYAAYATITFNDGSEESMVLSKKEVDSIRARSKSKNSGPWVTDYNEMAKKSAFRRLAKWFDIGGDDYYDNDSDDEEPTPSTATANAHALFAEPCAPVVLKAPEKKPEEVTLDDIPAEVVETTTAEK